MVRGGMCCALVALAGGARAATEAQISVSASSGVTDNVRGVADDQPAGDLEPEGDVFFGVGPSLRVWRDGSRLVLSATLGAHMSRYVSASRANQLGARAGLELELDLAPTWRADVAVGARYVDSGAVQLVDVTGAVPEGGAHFVGTELRVRAQKSMSRTLRLTGSAGASLIVPVGDDSGQRDAVSATAGAGVQLSRPRDAFELRLEGTVNRYGAAESATVMAPASTDYVLGLTGSWLRELDPLWNLLLSGGATLTFAGDSPTIGPVARAAVTRRGRVMSFDASVSQAVNANLLLARTFATSEASVGLTALVAERLALRAEVGASHSRVLDDSDEPSVNSLRATARGEYQIIENFGVALEYQFLFQVTGSRVEGGDARTLRTNTAIASLVAYWPPPDRRRREDDTTGLGLHVRQSEERDELER